MGVQGGGYLNASAWAPAQSVNVCRGRPRRRVVDLAVVVGSAAEELDERIDQRCGHGGAHLPSCFVAGPGLGMQIAAEDSAQYRHPVR